MSPTFAQGVASVAHAQIPAESYPEPSHRCQPSLEVSASIVDLSTPLGALSLSELLGSSRDQSGNLLGANVGSVLLLSLPSRPRFRSVRYQSSRTTNQCTLKYAILCLQLKDIDLRTQTARSFCEAEILPVIHFDHRPVRCRYEEWVLLLLTGASEHIHHAGR